MKKLITSLLTACLMSSTGLSFADAAQSDVTSKVINKSPVTELLFLQRGESAILKKANNTYTLTINNVGANLEVIPTAIHSSQLKHGFADYVQSVSMVTYLTKAWNASNGSFPSNNPNATLVGEYRGQTQIVTLTISNAQYNAKTHTMTYNIALLNGNNADVNQKLKNISLFIDGACGGSDICQAWL